MPKVSVYLPDDLYDEVRRRGLPLSALTQQALRRELAGDTQRAWIARMRAHVTTEAPATTTEDLMEAVADEFGE